MDELLLKRAIKGDADAFTSIVLEYEQQLYKIARIRLDNEHDICDAIQNTLFSVYKNMKKVKNLSFFKTWMIKILINECNSIYSKSKKNIVSFQEKQMENYIGANADFETVEDEIDFLSIIKILNYEEQQIITLFYSCDLSLKEISSLINVNINTVKTRLSRAKSKIKKNLEGGKNYE